MAMAPQILPSTATTPPPPAQTTLISPPSRQPLPLSSKQEAEIRAIYYKRVRTKCASEIQDFAQCCKNRSFSIAWMCRDTQLKMNTCMMGHANRDEEDAAREEWFSGMEERRRVKREELEAVEVRRKEVFRLMDLQKERERVEAEMKRKGVVEEVEGKGKGWWK